MNEYNPVIPMTVNGMIACLQKIKENYSGLTCVAIRQERDVVGVGGVAMVNLFNEEGDPQLVVVLMTSSQMRETLEDGQSIGATPEIDKKIREAFEQHREEKKDEDD